MERYISRSSNNYSQSTVRSQGSIYESEYAQSQQNKQSINRQVSSVQTTVLNTTTRPFNSLYSQNQGLHSRNPQQSQINLNNDQNSQQYLNYNPNPLTSQSTGSTFHMQNSNYQSYIQSQYQQQNLANSRNQYDANVNPMQREEQKIDLNQDSSPFMSSGNYNHNYIAGNQNQTNQGANISNNRNSTSFGTHNQSSETPNQFRESSFLRNKNIIHQSIQQKQGVTNTYNGGNHYNFNIPNIAQGNKIVINIYHYNCCLNKVPNQGEIDDQEQIEKRRQILIEIENEKEDNAFQAVNGEQTNLESIISGSRSYRLNRSEKHNLQNIATNC